MSLFFNRSAVTRDAALDAIPARSSSPGGYVSVTADSALRHSAVWAALRLRADLISTLPLDVYRRVSGVQTEMPKPALLRRPSANESLSQWLYASQVDLDRYGNAFGLVKSRDPLGLPSQVELVPAALVSVRWSGGAVDHYTIDGVRYEPSMVWHERQFAAAGIPVGLSPIAYAAWSIGGYLSAQQFALDWFGSGAAPSGHLRNAAKTLTAEQAADAKAAYKTAMTTRDVLVTGSDWEFTMAAVPANTVMFLDEMKYGVSDVARFFGVPGDLIDAEGSSSSITYANVTQRNLQLLILNLGPAIVRREAALSAALSTGRYAKFNTDALLRMDPASRTQTILAQVAGRVLTPTEARELDNRPPFTPDQVDEFATLFGTKRDQTIAETIQKVYLGVGKVLTSDEAREIANAAGANLPVPGPPFPAAPTVPQTGVTP